MLITLWIIAVWFLTLAWAVAQADHVANHRPRRQHPRPPARREWRAEDAA